jgi:hypothetical protein
MRKEKGKGVHRYLHAHALATLVMPNPCEPSQHPFIPLSTYHPS